MALIPVVLGVLIVGLSYGGAKQRSKAMQGCGICANCISLVFVVLGLAAAGFGYVGFHAETVKIEACCPTLRACDWAASNCTCNATLSGTYTLEVLPKSSPLCLSTTAHERRTPGRRGGGGDRRPSCLDKHDCEHLESEVASPFQVVTLPFLLALVPCLPGLASCFFGVSLCRDARHVPRLGYDTGPRSYVTAPRGTSTNSAARAPVAAAIPVVNPYPKYTKAQQAALANAPRDYRSPREDTIGL
jgi:hypothetical protein